MSILRVSKGAWCRYCKAEIPEVGGGTLLFSERGVRLFREGAPLHPREGAQHLKEEVCAQEGRVACRQRVVGISARGEARGGHFAGTITNLVYQKESGCKGVHRGWFSGH